MSETLPIRKTHSVFDEVRDVQNRVMERAYEIFRGTGGALGRDLENWLSAERELVWKPPIELREKDHEFSLEVAAPGVEAKDIDIEVTPEHILVKAQTSHEHKEEKGDVHTCEFEAGSMFRAIHLPKRINPEKVKAQFKDGLLTLTAEIAEEAGAKKVIVDAA